MTQVRPYFLLFICICCVLIFQGCSSENPVELRAEINRFVTDRNSGISNQKALELIQSFTGIIKEKMSSADHLLLAAAYDQLNDAENAMQQLAMVPDTDALAANARFSEAQIAFFKRRQALFSEKSLLKAISLKPDFPEALSRIGTLYDIQNRIEMRNRVFQSLDEKSALKRDELLLWTVSRRLDSVETAYQQALSEFVKSDTNDFHSRIALCDHLRLSGNFEEARHLINQISATDHDQIKILLQIEILIDQGELQKAVEMVKIIDADKIPAPFTGRFHFASARLSLFQKKPDQAFSILTQLLQREPLNRQAIQLIIQVMRFQNKKNESAAFEHRLNLIDQLEDKGQKARATLYQNDKSWAESIAAIAMELGQTHLARAWLRTLLANDPLNDSLQKRIYQLDQKLKKSD
jgi:tetratricopeptide (TPR) repeat protein